MCVYWGGCDKMWLLIKPQQRPLNFFGVVLGIFYASATHEIKSFYLIHFLKECIERGPGDCTLGQRLGLRVPEIEG